MRWSFSREPRPLVVVAIFGRALYATQSKMPRSPGANASVWSHIIEEAPSVLNRGAAPAPMSERTAHGSGSGSTTLGIRSGHVAVSKRPRPRRFARSAMLALEITDPVHTANYRPEAGPTSAKSGGSSGGPGTEDPARDLSFQNGIILVDRRSRGRR
jgi:hypothetical protein